jgi:hypothetical protein
MVEMRRKKPYHEECVFIPITRKPKTCIEDKFVVSDFWHNKEKVAELAVLIVK